MIINIPVDAGKIIDRLREKGFDAYTVGGCVRDNLLGKNPDDWDICTSALPDKVKEIFDGCLVLETGLKHGTVTVRFNHQSYEITTYRIDGEYVDNRRPKNVQFVKSLKEDLARRDFTINAMAYNSFEGLIDYNNGCNDLRDKIIRCVGNPDKRFDEDALRILRALRFSSVLDFNIEKETSLSIHRNKELLNNIAKERINVELCKLLCGKGVRKVLLEYADVFSIILPEIKPMIGFQQKNPHHLYGVWEHTAVVVENSEDDIFIKLAALLHDIAKPDCYTCDEKGIGHFYGHAEFSSDIAKNILRNLKFSNEIVNNVVQLIKYHDADISKNSKSIKRWLNRLGEVQFKRLLKLKHADVMGQSDYKRQEKLKTLQDIEKALIQVLEEKQCFSLKDLAINGRDLIQIGIIDGKQIGQNLDNVLKQVIENNIENNKDDLLSFIKNMTK